MKGTNIKSLVLIASVALLALTGCLGSKNAQVASGPAPERLFVKGTDRILIGDCRTYWVQLVTNQGNPQAVSEGRSVQLYVGGEGSFVKEDGTPVLQPSGAQIFSDAGCTTPLTTAEVAPNQNSLTLYIRDYTVEPILIIAYDRTGVLKSGSLYVQTFGPTKTTIAGQASLLSEACSAAYIVSSLDDNNALFELPFDVSFQMSSTGAASFFTDANCNVPMPNNQFRMPEGTKTYALYYKNLTPGNIQTITASPILSQMTPSGVNVQILNQASITATPTISFTETEVGFLNTATVTFTNPGDVAATGLAFTVNGSGFALRNGTSNNCGTSLAAKASCTKNIEFAPTSNTTFNGSLSVAFFTGVKQGVPVTRTFSGTGFYNAGVLDPSLNSSGTATVAINSTGKHAGAVQADGKLLIAAPRVSIGSKVIIDLARFTTAGVLDTSFSGDGKAQIDGGANSLTPEAMLVQSDGKILVAGSSNGDCFLARVSGSGVVETLRNYNLGGNDSCKAMATQGNNIVLVGSSNGNMAIMRANSNDLSLDTAFGSGGFSTLAYSGNDELTGVVVLSDGSFLAGGSGSSKNQMMVAKFKSNGIYDNQFGTIVPVEDPPGGGPNNPPPPTVKTGYFAYSVGGYSITAMTIQVDGVTPKVVAAASNLNSGSNAIAVYRILTNGSFDSFGSGGVASISLSNAATNAIAVQADSKILVAGKSGNSMVIARFNSNGSRDTGFNKGLGYNSFLVSATAPTEATHVGLQTVGNKVRIIASGRSAAGEYAMGRVFKDKE